MKKNNMLFLTEVAVFSALAILLDFISNQLSLKVWAQGGSISLTMIPIMLIAFRWGIKGGLTVGLITGILQLFIGSPQIAHPLQIALDYPLAFAGIGLAAIFAGKVQKAAKESHKAQLTMYLLLGAFLGSLIRYMCHVISGYVFFSHYAPEDVPALLYSFIYNGTYMLPSFIITAVLLVALFASRTQLLRVSKASY